MCRLFWNLGELVVSQDRRIHYRVTPNIERDVHVFAVTPTGATHQVGLVDISAGGVAFGVDQDNKLQADIGDILVVRFENGRLQKPLEIRAALRHEKSEDCNVVYGVEFQSWNDERHRLAPKLRSLFNEREAVRVEPRDDDELDVEIHLQGNTNLSGGLLRDISVLGIGIWLQDEDQALLDGKESMTLGVRLEPDEEPMEISVRVRHTQQVGERVRIGAQILPDEKHDARAQKKRIMAYVMKRQIEVARIDAERRRAMQAHYPTG